MDKILKFLTKHWAVISVAATIVGSIVTGGLHLKGQIDGLIDTVNDTKSWVSSHDDDIQDLHDKVIRLEALEEAREKGICK
jgi:archaellum component FlaC